MQVSTRSATHKAMFFGLASIGIITALGISGCGNQRAQQSSEIPENAAPDSTATTGNTMGSADNIATNSATGTAVLTDTPEKAIAVLHPTKGSDVRGTVTFTQEKGGVRIVADIAGLSPGAHGFHAHENGDCSAPDAASAGGHFNPTAMPHNSPDAEQRHVGDFGNLTADASGRARYNQLNKMVTLTGPNSIIGRAIIVHAKADDLKSQPSGDAGDREACGVVGIDVVEKDTTSSASQNAAINATTNAAKSP